MKRYIARLKSKPAALRGLAIVLGVATVAGGLYWTSSARETPSTAAERKALYYKNPMGTGHVSDRPLKDDMGMDYIPVYVETSPAGSPEDAGVVRISPAVIQNMGVRTAQVVKGAVVGEIEANGVLALNETATTTITTKIDGYIEKLHVTAVGQTVNTDDPLFDIYSPDLDARLQEYLGALRYQDSLPAHAAQTLHRNATELVVAAHMRLESLGIRKTQLKKMAAEGAVPRVLTFYSPQHGTVLKKNVLEGSSITAGSELFQLADLSTLWVLADVYAQDYAALRVGNRARVSVQGLPGKVFEGRVDFIYPTQDAQTRTAKVRIGLRNPQRLLRPDMYATVTIQGGAQAPQLLLPKSAVLRTGRQDLIILALGDGRFRPQPVTLGTETREHYVALAGIAEGDLVVTSAQFLLDSESRVQEAVQKMQSERTPARPNLGPATKQP